MPSLDDELTLEESLWRCLEASSKSPVRRLYLKGWGKTYDRDKINAYSHTLTYIIYPRHSLFQFHLQNCRLQITRRWLRLNLNTQFLTHLSNEYMYNVNLTCMYFQLAVNVCNWNNWLAQASWALAWQYMISFKWK